MAATANSYDCVVSRTTRTTEIGAPTTAAVTAANPAIGKSEGTVAKPPNIINLLRNPPAAAPIKAAGEKTPPNKPKPMLRDVASNLSINKTNKNPMPYPPLMILLISRPPVPKISGTKNPTRPQIKAAISMSDNGPKLLLMAIFAV